MRPGVNAVRPAIDAQLLELVRSRSGGTDAQVVRAFETLEAFRSLCADLRTCARALERWQASDAQEAPDRVVEYAGLMDDLASEIRELLSEGDRSGEGRHV
jgi:hypothetical protein